MSKLAVTLVKSPIGNRPAARATVKAIGLRRIWQTVVLPDNESVRGMIKSVSHLLQVEPASEVSEPVATVHRGAVTVTKGVVPKQDSGGPAAESAQVASTTVTRPRVAAESPTVEPELVAASASTVPAETAAEPESRPKRPTRAQKGATGKAQTASVAKNVEETPAVTEPSSKGEHSPEEEGNE